MSSQPQFWIVSFFTRGSGYEEHALRLAESASEHGYRCVIKQKRHRGSWGLNCAEKPRFIAEMLRHLREPVLWVDADGEIKERMAWLEQAIAKRPFDFSAYLKPNGEYRSGTILFRPTDASFELLSNWAAEADRVVGMDHKTFTAAIKQMGPRATHIPLPLPYVKIFDLDKGHAIIEHHQASRGNRKAMNEGLPHPHALIVGSARSGTTILSNLMTNYRKKRLVMIEPNLQKSSGILDRIRMDLRELGYNRDNDQSWDAKHVLKDFEHKRIAWGLKEIFPQGIKKAMSLHPKRIILIHRDMRHSTMSEQERMDRIHRGSYRQLFSGARQSINIMKEYGEGLDPQSGAPGARALEDGRVFFLVSYDRLVSSREYLNGLASLMNWPLEGNPSRGFHLWDRQYEVERHKGNVSAKSTAMRHDQWKKHKHRFLPNLQGDSSPFIEYQETFGYRPR